MTVNILTTSRHTMVILNLGPLGQFEFRRRRKTPEVQDSPLPRSPEDVFRYQRAPRVPRKEDGLGASRSHSQADDNRHQRASPPTPTNTYDEPPPYSTLTSEVPTASLDDSRTAGASMLWTVRFSLSLFTLPPTVALLTLLFLFTNNLNTSWR